MVEIGIIDKSRYGNVRYRVLHEHGITDPSKVTVIEVKDLKGRYKSLVGFETKDDLKAQAIEKFDKYKQSFELEKELMKKLGFFCYGYGDYFLDGLSISTRTLWLSSTADFFHNCIFRGLIDWSYIRDHKRKTNHPEYSSIDFIFDWLSESEANFHLLPSKMRDGLLTMDYDYV